MLRRISSDVVIETPLAFQQSNTLDRRVVARLFDVQVCSLMGFAGHARNSFFRSL